MPDNSSAVESKPKRAIVQDAEVLVSKMEEVEALLALLSPSGTSDDSIAEVITRGLDDLNCLRIVSVACADPDMTAGALAEEDVDKSVAEQIGRFGRKYKAYGKYLTRLRRSEQGYTNELTGIASRPGLSLMGNDVTVELEVYSHDRLLVTAKNELDGLATFVSYVVGALNKTVEKLNELSPELVRGSLNGETVAEIVKRVDRFKELVSPIVKQEPK